MSWSMAAVRALAVFVYFVVATVWLPDFVLQLDSVAGASSFLRDAIVVVVWGGGLAGGFWLLRAAQRRGLV